MCPTRGQTYLIQGEARISKEQKNKEIKDNCWGEPEKLPTQKKAPEEVIVL